MCETLRCEYCGCDKSWPCRNTRDMEESGEGGDRECFYQLARLGGGEKGLRYVIANCEARRERIQEREREPNTAP